MMGVAENIADLRSLLSIVAEDTGALTLDDADEESVGWTTEGPLPMTFGHVRRAHAALAALEAALSTDAEPVGFRWTFDKGATWYYGKDNPGSFRFGNADEIQPLYSEPVKTAPAVAVKARKPKLPPIGNELYEFYPSMSAQTHADAVKDYARAAVSAALSAQVQDVAVPALKIGIYGKAYDRPDDRRAYTYDDQPHNVEAHKLGRACSGIHSGGDWIDRGLNLLKALQAEGFDACASPASKNGGP